MGKKAASIKRKELTKFERINSFDVVAPVVGSLGPLSLSRDVILRKGQLGIGFVLDNFLNKTIVSPIDGVVVSIFGDGSGYIIKDEFSNVHVVVKVTEEIRFLYGTGFQPLQKVGKEIRKGTPILKVDRELFIEKRLHFQLTMCFYRSEEEKKESGVLYDILYKRPASENNLFEKRSDIAIIYQVKEKKSIDHWEA